MGYQHIENLYKNQDIMFFKECYALEKIHGTGAHVGWKNGVIQFHSGSLKHDVFVALFNKEELQEKFIRAGHERIFVYGEAYGEELQKMEETYGDELKFVAFDVNIGDSWLSVPKADSFTKWLGLEFVHYDRIPCTIESINQVRDSDSVQAVRNGMGNGKIREGVVLRPLEEFTKDDGSRIISKHKRDEFSETNTPREFTQEKQALLSDAQDIADEWVTEMRLTHVLDKIGCELAIRNTGKVIAAMIEDIEREAVGEIVLSKEAASAIGKATASMFKNRL